MLPSLIHQQRTYMYWYEVKYMNALWEGQVVVLSTSSMVKGKGVQYYSSDTEFEAFQQVVFLVGVHVLP